MNAQPRLGMLAFLDIPVDCRMSGAVDQEGDVRFTVGGPYDEFEIVFEPAALDRFMRLGFELLSQSARVNPKALAARDGRPDIAQFAYGAEALRKLATLSDALAQTGAVATPEPHTALDDGANAGELVDTGRRSA